MNEPVLITGGAGSVGRQLAGMFLAEGRPVRIFDLPFMDFSGMVQEVNHDKQKLKVLVSIFGRQTPVELDYLQVKLEN